MLRVCVWVWLAGWLWQVAPGHDAPLGVPSLVLLKIVQTGDELSSAQ